MNDLNPPAALPRLSSATLKALRSAVTRPSYERDALRTGIVHLGLGAFHRAHQAAYTDAALNGGDRDWMIVGVSLRGQDVPAQLNPQEGLYTLTSRSDNGQSTQLIGAVRKVLHAPSQRSEVVATLAAADTRIVTFTVTEKGYCRATHGGLDFEQAHEGSIYGLLVEALSARRQAGLAGLTLLSCDNLAANGEQLSRLLGEALERQSSALRAWFEQECACPSTMVDRIVPATSTADRAELALRAGVRDEAAVFTEPFTQWVIEDRFAGPRPDWEVAGARFTSDVHAHEKAKLRMLNGAHSALAYLGLERGHTYVHEAATDPVLIPVIDQLMRIEAAGSLRAAADQDLQQYADELLQRFRNPALQHRLMQIAMDGSQKIPQRWLETLQFHQTQGHSCPSILRALAAWLRHIRGDVRPVDDPLAGPLAACWRGGSSAVVDNIFRDGGPLVTQWRPTATERQGLVNELS